MVGYLEGEGGLISSLILGITWVTIWLIGATNLLTSPPDPPSKGTHDVSMMSHISHLHKTSTLDSHS